jgi:hypothetical protein
MEGQPIKFKQTETIVQGIASETTIGRSYDPDTKSNAELPKRTKAMGKSVFKVLKGSSYVGQEAILTFTTDTDGKFSFSIEPGNYCIVEQKRAKRFVQKKHEKGEVYDSSCLRKEWAKPLVTFEVAIGEPIKLDLSVEKYLKHCHPCLVKSK